MYHDCSVETVFNNDHKNLYLTPRIVMAVDSGKKMVRKNNKKIYFTHTKIHLTYNIELKSVSSLRCLSYDFSNIQ